jgi:hypothetical protein
MWDAACPSRVGESAEYVTYNDSRYSLFVASVRSAVHLSAAVDHSRVQ